MYRDDSTLIDEHDRAVGAIQIADGLISESVARVKQLNGPENAERWATARTVQEHYLEIWRQLDAARAVLAKRGANTLAFDELRADVLPFLHIREVRHPIDLAPLEDARRGVALLRLAIPAADWSAIEARTTRLLGTSVLQASHKLAVTAVLVGFSAALATWAYAATPEPRVDPRVEEQAQLRRELAATIDARRARIDELAAEIGDSCRAARTVSSFRARGEARLKVHAYMELLVMDGRFEAAQAFARDYQARCGEDVIVQNWASLKQPRKRDLW